MRIHRDTGFVYCNLNSWDFGFVYVICLFVCVLCLTFYYIVIA